jgi:hypothetical protein
MPTWLQRAGCATALVWPSTRHAPRACLNGQRRQGVAQDGAAARRWLQRAADGESPEALQQLAMEEPDPARAAQLFKEAAHALTHQVR